MKFCIFFAFFIKVQLWSKKKRTKKNVWTNKQKSKWKKRNKNMLRNVEHTNVMDLLWNVLNSLQWRFRCGDVSSLVCVSVFSSRKRFTQTFRLLFRSFSNRFATTFYLLFYIPFIYHFRLSFVLWKFIYFFMLASAFELFFFFYSLSLCRLLLFFFFFFAGWITTGSRARFFFLSFWTFSRFI